MTVATPVYDGTAPIQFERVSGPGQPHAHIENPLRPGYALCLVRIAGTRTTSGDCPLCRDLALENRAWVAR